MRFFFFGSLMDPDVRRLVLGREAAMCHAEAARLDGFRRYRVLGESFPMLEPCPGGSVPGLLMETLGAEALSRIAWFEDDDYEIRPCAIRRRDGSLAEAHVCLATERLRHEREPWDLARWQAVDKPQFLTLAISWMALYQTLSAPDRRLAWDRLKTAAAEPLSRRRKLRKAL